MQASLERLRARREEQGEGGFTLIELLIVIVILGILAAIVVFAVQNLSSSTAKSSCQADFKTVETATEAFKAQNGNYPGGTYSTVVVPAAGTAYPSYKTPTGGAPAGVLSLLGTTSTPAAPNNLGPWLKDAPVNGTHYEIAVSTDGKGTIQVYTADGTATIPATGATGTAADCSTVS